MPFSTWVRDNDPRALRVTDFVTAGPRSGNTSGCSRGATRSVSFLGAAVWSDGVEQLLRPTRSGCGSLGPPQDWRPGQPWAPATSPEDALLLARNFEDGSFSQFPISDAPVDNVQYSAGGGLQAHDYWNNTREFVPKLAEILRPNQGTLS
jgi:hypothetical protein